MATLYDGVPVFVPVAGATALASDQVALQAKLILGLEARYRPISLASAQQSDTGGWTIGWNAAATPPMTWVSSGAGSVEILFPVDLREEEVVTECHVTFTCAAGAPTGGSIVLYSVPNTGIAAAVAESDFGCAGNFWDVDGTITTLNATGLSIEAKPDSYYFVGVIGPTAAAQVATLYGLRLRTEFHKGT